MPPEFFHSCVHSLLSSEANPVKKPGNSLLLAGDCQGCGGKTWNFNKAGMPSCSYAGVSHPDLLPPIPLALSSIIKHGGDPAVFLLPRPTGIPQASDLLGQLPQDNISLVPHWPCHRSGAFSGSPLPIDGPQGPENLTCLFQPVLLQPWSYSPFVKQSYYISNTFPPLSLCSSFCTAWNFLTFNLGDW